MFSHNHWRKWARYSPIYLLAIICLLACNLTTPSATDNAVTSPPDDDLTNVEYRYDNLPDPGEDDGTMAEFRAVSKWGTSDLTYYFINGTDQLPADREHEILREAFNIWEAETPLRFTETSDRRTANIEIGWAKGNHGDGDSFDGRGGVLAHAGIPNPFTAQQKVILHFDDSERWVDHPRANVDLLTVAIHEIGHTLGLDHSRDPNAIMFASYMGPNRKLSSDDIAGIQSLYGMATTPPADTPPKTADVCPELLAGVQSFLGRAIRLEIQAFEQGDASVVAGIMTGSVYDSVESNIATLNNRGLVQISQIDYQNSYIQDVRIINNRHLEVDTCETWQSSLYQRTNSQLQNSGDPTLLPQTLTIERLQGGWFITGVDFQEMPAFCNPNA